MESCNILYQTREGLLLADSLQPLHKYGGSVCQHHSTRYINVELEENKKILPELYKAKELCCGCSACFAVCPKSSSTSNAAIQYQFLDSSSRIDCFLYTGAISMLPDEEGFLYPVVDASKCIRCYKCLSVCPYNQDL